MHLWVASDHGHSPVRQHEDLVGLMNDWGYRTLAHPWAFNPTADIAVMVSGNAMTHLYVDLERTVRTWWPAIRDHWQPLVDRLLVLPSVDLLMLPTSVNSCEVHGRERGHATLSWRESRYTYTPLTGDPLCVGARDSIDDAAAHELTLGTEYPDSLVQIAHLVTAARSGDIILSAARDWDFRARYEPIPHVSSHGALHREHMLVPLLINHRPKLPPRRTVDTMPSALAALGIAIPGNLDGVSFL
jgi:hypothetical protein